MKLLYKKLSLLILLTSLSFACSNRLDTVPNASPTEGNFWKTEADLNSAIYGMYADLTSEFTGSEAMYGRGYFWINCVTDDIAIGRSRARVENMRSFTCTGDEYELTNLWTVPFLFIKRANDIIRNAPEMEVNESLKKRAIAEAKFMAAEMYFQLATIYGHPSAGLPILDPMKPSEINVPRASSVSDNYKMIVQYMEEAGQDLPYFSDLEPSDWGRAHKTVAWAYGAKAALYNQDWAKAEELASKVVSSNQHQLLSDFGDVFKIENEWSKEYLWSVVSNDLLGSMLPGVMLENKGWGQYNGWGYMKPTLELYEAFEDGDKRREVTILKPGDKFNYFGNENFEYVPGTDAFHTGLQFNKYMQPYQNRSWVSGNGDYPTTELNIPLMRYAEVVLILAEAKLMQGKNADAEINQIRTRAGLKAVSGATISDLKKERRCELAGEINDRNRDLVRWGDAKATYAKPTHKFNGDVIVPARDISEAKLQAWPIPPTQIDASDGVLTQTPGW